MRAAIVAKTIIINDQNQILLLRRSSTDDVRPGKNDFPGGSVDPGEDIMFAAVREIKEEANIDIDQNALRLGYANTVLHNDEMTVTRLLFIVACPPNPKVILSHEHDKFWWHPFDEVIQEMDHTSWVEGLEFMKKHDLMHISNITL